MIGFKNLWSMINDLIQNNVLILQDNAAPTATTAAKVAGKGSLYVDRLNGVLYINTGTTAIPTWTKVGSQT